MAYFIPDGTRFAIATATGAPVSITGISNATTAVVSAASHGLAAKAPFILMSGWEDLNEGVFRAASPTTGTFELEGVDSTNVITFPTGSGGGSLIPVTTWTEIQQVLNVNTSGGEQQYAEAEPLSQKYSVRIPTRFSAQSMELEIGDDPTLPGYVALINASRATKPVAIRMAQPGGAVAYGYGYISVSEMPQLQKGQVNRVKASIALQRPIRRYAN